jgi:hypothetical protein
MRRKEALQGSVKGTNSFFTAIAVRTSNHTEKGGHVKPVHKQNMKAKSMQSAELRIQQYGRVSHR